MTVYKGQSTRRGPGAETALVRETVGQSPLKLKHIWLLDVLNESRKFAHARSMDPSSVAAITVVVRSPFGTRGPWP